MPAPRHAKKISARRLTLLLTLLVIGGLVLWALVYSVVSPGTSHGTRSASPSPGISAAQHPSPSKAPHSHVTPPKPLPATSHPSKPPKPPVTRYTVKTGDSLSSVAAKFHLRSYIPLYDANRAAVGSNPNLIHTGLRLVIPGGNRV